jgi:hypothetical protein
MTKIKSVLMCGLVLAFAGATSLVMAAAAPKSTQATVRAIKGTATYSINGGPDLPLRPNMELDEHTLIKTGPDSQVDLSVNGRTSTVRITASTTVTLDKMLDLGAGDSETTLDLKDGLILGSVKKITKESKYEISTPRGIAGIRGTDFAVQVTQQGNGTYTVTFTSVTGTVIVVSNISINGVTTPVTKVLVNGQSWTPPATAASLQDPLITLYTAVAVNIAIGFSGPGGLNNGGAPGNVNLPPPPPPPVRTPPVENPSQTGGS